MQEMGVSLVTHEMDVLEHTDGKYDDPRDSQPLGDVDTSSTDGQGDMAKGDEEVKQYDVDLEDEIDEKLDSEFMVSAGATGGEGA